MASAGTAFVDVQPDLSGFMATLESKFGPLTGKFGTLGKVAGGALAGGLVAAGIGKALYDIGAQFDDAYDTIRVGTGATGKELEGLKDVFRDVVRDVPTDFGTAADAITDVNRRLGLTGKPLKDVSEQFLELSRLTGTDLKGNIEAVSKAFVDWEVPVSKQSKVLDGFFRISQESGASVSDLAASVQQFGSPLRQLGFTLEESASMFATFEKAGVNTSTMVPGLKLALANLVDPTADLSKHLKQLGVDAKDPGDQLRQVFDLLSGDALKDTEKMSLAMEVFGRRAGADMAEAIKQGRFEVSEMIDVFKNGKETIRGAAADTNDLSENWQMFKNKVLVALEPIATKVFEGINHLMEGLIDAMDVLSKKGPAALKDVEQALEPLLKVLKVVWTAAQDAIDGIVKAFKGGFEMIGGIVKVFSGLFSGDWDKLWDGVKGIVRGAWDAIKGIFQAMTAPLRDLAKRIWEGVKDVIDSVTDRIKDIVSNAWDAVKNLTSNAFDRVKAIIEGAWDRIKSIVDGAVDRVKTILSGAWDAIKSGADAAWERVKAIVSGAWDAIKGVIDGAVDRIKSILSGAWDAIKGAADAAWGRVKDLIIQPVQSAIDWLSGVPGKMLDLGKKIMQGLWDGIKSLVNDVKSTITSVVDWVTGKVNLLNNKVDEAFEAVKSISNAVAQGNNKAAEMPKGDGKSGKVAVSGGAAGGGGLALSPNVEAAVSPFALTVVVEDDAVDKKKIKAIAHDAISGRNRGGHQAYRAGRVAA